MIDARTFRDALGRFATGITVVSSEAGDGVSRGITVNAFLSLSLEPPLVGVSIDRSADAHEGLLRAESYGVSMLAEGQSWLSDRFAGRPILGVHIRRGDALKGPKREHYLPSTDEAFEKVMRAWDGAFFLATDCEETESRFREMFGDRILTRGKPWVPSEFGVVKEGQRDAVADLFLLSRTRRVIGTRHSSFGHVAALMGGVDYQVAL